MPKIPKKGKYVFIAIYLASISFLSFAVDRSETFVLLTTYTTAFVAFLFLLQIREQNTLLTIIGITARFLLFFSLPVLSDDLYRFIWDGILTSNQLNPYAELPSFYLTNPVEGLSNQLFKLLNSPNYFSVYPPLNQAFFWIAVEIGNPNWLFEANVLRVILLFSDVAAFLFLKRLLSLYRRPEFLAYAYFLNPLVVLEFTGNLHFEGLIICLLLAGIYFYETHKKWFSATAFGLAIATKLLPLIFLPFLFLKGLKNKKWQVPIISGLIGMATFLPLLSSDFVEGMAESLELYFHTFEFNASIYFLLREIGFWLTGYNQIGTIGTYLALATFLIVLFISFLGVKNKWSIPTVFLFALSSYLLLATTVHPWYVLPLLAFGLLSGYWYPMLWSYLIFFTYAGYGQDGFELPTLIIVVEYVLVILMAVTEIKQKYAHKKNISIDSIAKPF